jgi:nucleotide-binding universal stress UspA family protein
MYDRILVPLDGSEEAIRALMQALVVCRLAHNAASARPAAAADSSGAVPATAAALPLPVLRLLYVLDDALDQSNLVAEGNAALAAAADLAWEAGVAVEHAVVPAAGRALATAILADAGDFAADLIVLGTHGRKGLRRAILGSVAEAVIRDSPIPVLLPGRPKG